MGKNKKKASGSDTPVGFLPAAAAAATGFVAAGSMIAAYYYIAQQRTHPRPRPPPPAPLPTPLPTTSVPIVAWERGATMEEFPRVAWAAWEAHHSPVLLRGVPLTTWAGPALWAPPEQHQVPAIAAEIASARPSPAHARANPGAVVWPPFKLSKHDSW